MCLLPLIPHNSVANSHKVRYKSTNYFHHDNSTHLSQTNSKRFRSELSGDLKYAEMCLPKLSASP